jgi:hypothetical protein
MSASNIGTPSHAEIAARAEQIYVESGSVAGRDLENWVQAEKELKGRMEVNGAVPAGKPATKGKNGVRAAREKQRA